jgi:indolepyruvate ferredoxin oxidoreductase beta subunit
MRKDIVLSGVGGQGVLSVAAIIAEAARREGLFVKQGEVHGMSQRGGAVQAFLRIAGSPVRSDLVAEGTADLILSLEPIESLRYVRYLKPDGMLITSIDPVLNIPSYPPREEVEAMLHQVPNVEIIEANALAKEAGSLLAANVVIVGAASRFLPISPETMEQCMREGWARKGQRVVDFNIRAFRAGRDAVACAAT